MSRLGKVVRAEGSSNVNKVRVVSTCNDIDRDFKPAASLTTAPIPKPAPDPKVVIDHTAFPHIIDAILDNAALQTLLVFRGTCTAYRDRIERDLEHITIADPDDRGESVEARTKDGYFLWSLPGVQGDLELGIHLATMVFRRYVGFHNARKSTITVDLVGDPDLGTQITRVFERTLRRHFHQVKNPRTRFRIVPDSKGRSRVTGHGWDGPRILVDSHKGIPHMAKWFKSGDYVFSISGRECSVLTRVDPPPGSTVIYDFSSWKPSTSDCSCLEASACVKDDGSSGCKRSSWCPNRPDFPASRMDWFVQHIVDLLARECVVYIFGIQRIDFKWLEPSLKIRAAGLPMEEYLRDTVIRRLHPLGYWDILTDLDLLFHIMPSRSSWQSHFGW